MILLLGAALLGGLTGLVIARLGQRPYRVPQLRWSSLVCAAFLPQYFAFISPATRAAFPDVAVRLVLLGSQLLLLAFALLNRPCPGFKLLGLGLGLNLAVIAANGGLMPISPETIQQFGSAAAGIAWEVGQRFGTGKDVVLTAAETRLAFLSDCWLLPAWVPYKAAFSLGDGLIALGAFWLLLSSGGYLVPKEMNPCPRLFRTFLFNARRSAGF